MHTILLLLLPFLAFARGSTPVTSAAVTAQPSLSTPEESSWYQPIPEQLQQFIAQFNNPHPDGHEYEKRQHGVGGAPGEAAATTVATQMSPVTTALINGKPVVFTQTFAPTPDPWAGPINGAIGLGTIKGSVGVVKSDS